MIVVQDCPDIEIVFANSQDRMKILSSLDESANQYDNKVIAYGKILKMDSCYVLFYQALGVKDDVREDNYHFLIAYSYDGIRWERGVPKGVTPPVKGTNKLLEDGRLNEPCWFKVNDQNYPWRMVANEVTVTPLKQKTMKMWRSKDGFHYEEIGKIIDGYHDAQPSAIVEDDKIKLYIRLWNDSFTNRRIGVAYVDNNGNLLKSPSFFLGDYLYQASASSIGYGLELLLPTFYNDRDRGGSQDIKFLSYIVNNNKVKKINTNINESLSEEEKWAVIYPGIINIDDKSYVVMNSRCTYHNESATRETSATSVYLVNVDIRINGLTKQKDVFN